jgi:hypothetical protein
MYSERIAVLPLLTPGVRRSAVSLRCNHDLSADGCSVAVREPGAAVIVPALFCFSAWVTHG